MKRSHKNQLEAAGMTVGSAKEFLGLPAADARRRRRLPTLPPPAGYRSWLAAAVATEGDAQATLRLRGPSGRLHADRVAEVFGYTRAKLGRLGQMPPRNLLATPEAESIQDKLKPFEQIARPLLLHDDEIVFRDWLRTPNTEFDGKTPSDIIVQKGPHIVADLVRDIITNRGG